jgi:hypothetical protein
MIPFNSFSGDKHNLTVNFLGKEIELKNITNKKAVDTQIYVMIDKNTGYYKIGRSVNPKIRERTLQSEKPTIEMIFSYLGLSSDEKELHEMFFEKRIRGEWFDLNGTDIQKIKNFFEKYKS